MHPKTQEINDLLSYLPSFSEENYSYSWSLPFYRDKDGLIVHQFSSRLTWSDKPQSPWLSNQCLLPHGSYLKFEESKESEKVLEIIEECWFCAGFAYAWPIKRHDSTLHCYRWYDYYCSGDYQEVELPPLKEVSPDSDSEIVDDSVPF